MPLLLSHLRRANLTLVLAISVAGCGGSGEDPFNRADVNGTVNFDGMPLAYGEILFRAEAAKVNDELPQASLTIRDGKFQSNPASQPGQGQNKVIVSVYEGAAPPPADPNDESGNAPPDPKVVGYYQGDLDVQPGKPLQVDIKKEDLSKQFPE